LEEFEFGPAEPSSTPSSKSTGEKKATFRTVKEIVEYSMDDLEVDFPDDGGLDQSTEASLPVYRARPGQTIPGDEYHAEKLLDTLIFQRFARLEW